MNYSGIPGSMKEKTKFTLAFNALHDDDSESDFGAIDDVLISPRRCQWRQVVARKAKAT